MDVVGELGGAPVWWGVGDIEHADSLVEYVKNARLTTAPPGRILVVASEVTIDSSGDYDSIGALAAAIIRLRIDQWIGLGQGAKALSTQVGLEGSWDGESLWVEAAQGAYDYLRVWPNPGDLIVVAGKDIPDTRALRGLIEGDMQ